MRPPFFYLPAPVIRLEPSLQIRRLTHRRDPSITFLYLRQNSSRIQERWFADSPEVESDRGSSKREPGQLRELPRIANQGQAEQCLRGVSTIARIRGPRRSDHRVVDRHRRYAILRCFSAYGCALSVNLAASSEAKAIKDATERNRYLAYAIPSIGKCKKPAM